MHNDFHQSCYLIEKHKCNVNHDAWEVEGDRGQLATPKYIPILVYFSEGALINQAQKRDLHHLLSKIHPAQCAKKNETETHSIFSSPFSSKLQELKILEVELTHLPEVLFLKPNFHRLNR